MGDEAAPENEEHAAPRLTDVDPVPPSARQALPPLAPPLSRGVQPVAAVALVCGLVVLWWLRKRLRLWRGSSGG